MIRKNALSLTLTAILALTMLVGLPAMNAAGGASHADEVPTLTATPGASTNSNPSGGGNGGG